MSFAPRYWAPLDRWVAPLGLGTWQLGGQHTWNGRPNGWRSMDNDAAIAIVQQAVEGGVEFIDTAQGYGSGRCEAIIGEALGRLPRGLWPAVCTKVPLTQREEREGRIGHGFRNRVLASIRRLGVETIDVLLIHGPPDDLDWRNFDCGQLERLRSEGLIRCFGVSSRGLTGAVNVIRSRWGQCVQWTFNLLERRAEDQLLPLMEESAQLFLARSPLAGGILTERFARMGPTWTRDEYRATLPEAFVTWAQRQLHRQWSGSPVTSTLSEFALRYALSEERLSSVVCGARSLSYVESMLSYAARGPLTRSEVDSVREDWQPFYEGWR